MRAIERFAASVQEAGADVFEFHRVALKPQRGEF